MSHESIVNFTLVARCVMQAVVLEHLGSNPSQAVDPLSQTNRLTQTETLLDLTELKLTNYNLNFEVNLKSFCNIFLQTSLIFFSSFSIFIFIFHLFDFQCPGCLRISEFQINVSDF